jgi:hypothetical protein
MRTTWKRSDLPTWQILEIVDQWRTMAWEHLTDRMGVPSKVALAALMRDTDRGLLDCGVSAERCWLTPAGELQLALTRVALWRRQETCDHPVGAGTICAVCGADVAVPKPSPDTAGLLKRAKAYLVQCPICDYGIGAPCVCPPGDERAIIQELVEAIERLEALLEGR